MLHNTTAAGHPKTVHDQIGGTVKTYLDRCSTSTGPQRLQLVDGPTLSSQVVDHCKKTFRWSHNRKLRRYFIELPVSLINDELTPFKRIVISKTADGKDIGVKSYHCCLIEAKRMRFRMVGCACDVCINGGFSRQCRNRLYAGKWSDWKAIEPHDTYPVRRGKVQAARKRQRHETNVERNSNSKKAKTSHQSTWFTSGVLKKYRTVCHVFSGSKHCSLQSSLCLFAWLWRHQSDCPCIYWCIGMSCCCLLTRIECLQYVIIIMDYWPFWPLHTVHGRTMNPQRTCTLRTLHAAYPPTLPK